MSEKKISILNVLIFALYLFPVVGANFTLFSYFMLYCVPIMYFLVNFKLVRKLFLNLKVNYCADCAFLGIMLFLSVSAPLAHNTGDFTYIWTVLGIVRKMIIYLFLTLVTYKTYKKENVLTGFLLTHSLASALYVVATMLFVLLSPLKTWWVGLWQFDHMEFLNTYGYTARFGWSGFSGYRETITCSISIVFLLYMINEKAKKNLSVGNLALFVLMGLNLIGNMFYGRSGVVVFAVVAVVSVFIYRRVRLSTVFKILLAAIPVIAIVIYIISSNEKMAEWLDWLTTPFINLITTGKMNNFSFDHLFNDMIFMPEKKTLWLGDGRYVDPRDNTLYYMGTDSGFMRQILFWGVMCTVFTYYYSIHSMKTLFNKQKWRFAVMLLAAYAIYEVKGEVYYQIIPLFTCLSLMTDWEDTTNKEVRQVRLTTSFRNVERI